MFDRRMNIDKTAVKLTELNRNQLAKEIRGFEGSFKMDFTDRYLKTASVDKLRHILLAALISCKNRN
jgi:hypothetical protein